MFITLLVCFLITSTKVSAQKKDDKLKIVLYYFPEDLQVKSPLSADEIINEMNTVTLKVTKNKNRFYEQIDSLINKAPNKKTKTKDFYPNFILKISTPDKQTTLSINSFGAYTRDDVELVDSVFKVDCNLLRVLEKELEGLRETRKKYK